MSQVCTIFFYGCLAKTKASDRLRVATTSSRAILLLISLLASICTVRPEEPRSPMPRALASLVLDTGRFKELRSLNQVPTDVVQSAFPAKPPADPGKPWNETDVVIDPSLPFMGLYWLVTDGTHWLFSYAHGGIAFFRGFVMVEKTGKAAPKIVWQAGAAEKQPPTFHEFQAYVRSNGLFSATGNYRE